MASCTLQERGGLGEPQVEVDPVAVADASPRDAGRARIPPLPSEPVEDAGEPEQVDATTAPEVGGPVDAGESADSVEADAGDAEVELCPAEDAREPAQEVPGSSGSGAPSTGPHEVVVEVEPSLGTHTIYRPRTLERAFPIVVWEGGACGRTGLVYAEFLRELSSHGFVSIISGAPYGTGTALGQDGAALVQAVNWAEAENQRRCGKYYHKLDTTRLAAMGASCGGGHVLAAGADARVSTAVLIATGDASQSALNALHQPLLYLVGGLADIAHGAADSDYEGITKGIPVFNANLEVGTAGTFLDDNGGKFASAAVAWLRWQLQGISGPDTSAQFEGKPCGLERDGWTVKKKNMK